MLSLALWIWLILLSYAIYPLLLKWLARGKRHLPYQEYSKQDDLPELSIFIPMHNEASVIEAKLLSILSSAYPAEKIKIYCGLDACTDETQAIVHRFQEQYPDQVEWISSLRIGKPAMLNLLHKHFGHTGELLILTDANVMFQRDTLFELARYFKDPEIGLTDAAFVLDGNQVSHQQEGDYLGMEQGLKFREGMVWGTMQGPFGGCYAIRSENFSPIPENFLVDDFFMAMQIMTCGYKAIVNPKAKVTEEVHTNWKDEFNRKKRISAGNFQNLVYFKKVFSKPITPLAFSFFHHKVLRWLLPVFTPLFFAAAIVETLCFQQSPLPLLVTLTLTIVPLPLHYFLQKLNLQIRTIDRLSYFVYINLALYVGFIHYIKGIESNVWKPTKRA